MWDTEIRPFPSYSRATEEAPRRIRKDGMIERRLLIVDDERCILDTLDVIFRQHGYRVVAVSTVAEALQVISSQPFDVLIADLNIGQPGDGFTVVSALRRTQPDAIALILTGYPAFDNALQAIREQVDDFLLKPIHPMELLKKVESTVHSHEKHMPLATKRVSDVLRQERTRVLQDLTSWLVCASAELGKGGIPGEELVDHLPDVLDELCRSVDEGASHISPEARTAAARHGTLRAGQGFDLMFICNESTAIRQAVLSAVHHNLLVLNMSYLFLDLTRMSDSLDEQWKTSIEAFIGATVKTQ